jgi:hypothetical protein
MGEEIAHRRKLKVAPEFSCETAIMCTVPFFQNSGWGVQLSLT